MSNEKSSLVGTKSTKQAPDSKGRDCVTVYLTEKQTTDLAQLAVDLANKNTRGVLSIHTEQKTNSVNGSTFPSSFVILREVQEQQGQTTATRFVPKAKPAPAVTGAAVNNKALRFNNE